MSETITLQQVRCPNCGSVITSFNPFQARVECPFCHTQSVNPMVTAKNVAVPERLIVYNTTEKDFEKKLVATLIKRDYVPTDIFQKIRSEDVIRAYLPMYLFEGTYQVSWSCEVGYEESETRYVNGKRETHTVTRYRPSNGQSQGNFSFLCPAYEGNEIPDELKHFSNDIPYYSLYSKPYDPALLGLDTDQAPITLAPSIDKSAAWNSKGMPKLKDLAEQTAKNQVSGQKTRGLHTTHSYQMQGEGTYVLVPFWFVYYTYNDQQRYYFVMDGMGEKTDCTTPVCMEEKQMVAKMWSRFYKMFWLLIAVAASYFLGGWTTVAIVGAVWLVATIIFGVITNKKVNAQLRASNLLREQSAQLLGLVERPANPALRQETPNQQAYGRPMPNRQAPNRPAPRSI